MSDRPEEPLVGITDDLSLKLGEIRHVHRFTVPHDALGPGPRIHVTLYNGEDFRFSESKLLPGAADLLKLAVPSALRRTA